MIFVMPATVRPFDTIEVFHTEPQVRVIRVHRDCSCQATYAGRGWSRSGEPSFQEAMDRAYKELEKMIGQYCTAPKGA